MKLELLFLGFIMCMLFTMFFTSIGHPPPGLCGS